MIYFVGREKLPDETKKDNKTRLRSAVYGVLENELLKKGVYLSEELCSNEHGKPFLKKHSNMFFNISHCESIAVCALEDTETGIDIEHIREWHPGVAKRCFSHSENEILKASGDTDEMFFRLWTLKESFVKALGIGISYPMKTCEFLIDGKNITSKGCDGYFFRQAVLNDRFVCSLCLKGSGENRFYRLKEQKQSLFCVELR